MRKSLLLLGLLALAVPATAQTVETGRTNWSKLPRVKKKSRPLDEALLTDWTQRLLATGECKIPRMRPDRFDVDVPYAVLVEPNGTVKRILIAETGCAGLNSLIGSTVYDWAQKGDFGPTGQQQALWYAGRITFAQQ